MNTQSNNFVQEFSFLFKRIKEDNNLPLLFKDESIYDAVVGFNTVKFLIEHDWSEDEDKACEVILQECNRMKKTEQKLGDEATQKLESKLKEKLKDYIKDGVEDVSIYGNHASITLENDKKEFEISEFLNSDFCKKNGISGFSTLHDDGKGGMHGFVHNKIRHYAVTCGSYEMTLNWYVNGKKCTIKINIDKDGVDLIERNGITQEQLEANKDVKIGGLFLHEIQFREKENKVQHRDNDKPSYETAIRKNDRNIELKKPVQRDKSIYVDQGEKRSETGGLFTHKSRKLSYDSGIGEDFDDKINSQEAKEKRELRQAARKENFGGQVYNLQSLFEENPQKKRTPPPVPPRSSSLKKDVFNEQRNVDHQNGRQSELSSSTTNIAQKRFSENILEKMKKESPIYKWLKDKVEGKENNQNLDALEEKLSKKYGQGNIVEKGENDGGKPPLPVSTGGNEKNLMDVESDDTRSQKSSRRSGREPEEEELNYQNIHEALESWKEKRPNKYRIDEDVKENTQGKIQSELHKDDLANVKAVEGLTVGISASTPDSKNDSGYSSPTNTDHHESQMDPEQLKKSLKNVKQNEIGQENGSLEDSLTDIKTNDSGHSSPITDHHESQVNPEQLKEGLTDVKQNDGTEFISKLDKETQKFPLRPVDQEKMSKQTREHLLEAGLLKDGLTDVKTPESSDNEFKEKLVEAEEKIGVSSSTVCNEPVDGKLQSAQPIIADQVMNELREILEKPGKGLKRSTQQTARRKIPLTTNSQNPFLGQIKHDKPIHQWLEKTLAKRENADKNSHCR